MHKKGISMPCILIVDDCIFSRSILFNALKKNGFENTVLAEDGCHVVDYYKKYCPDIIILDVTMPSRSGIEVLRSIIELDGNARVLMMSALGQEEIIVKCLKIGAKEFIVKPFKMDRFIKVVNRILYEGDVMKI